MIYFHERKGLSVERLAYLLFAVVGALIILVIFMNNITPQSTLFCSVYSGVYSLLPTGDSPPPLPRSCLGESSEVYDTEHIYSSQKQDVTSQIVDMIVGCYQKNKHYSNATLPCYRLEIAALNGTISEVDITDNMVETGLLCDTLENSIVMDNNGNKGDYFLLRKIYCGKNDQIEWLLEDNVIRKGTYVEIKYDSGIVKVIG